MTEIDFTNAINDVIEAYNEDEAYMGRTIKTEKTDEVIPIVAKEPSGVVILINRLLDEKENRTGGDSNE